MYSTNENPLTMEKALKKRKLNGITMFAIVFTLFVLILGITAGITYSGFQSTAESNGTLTFAINGHQGTLTLSNTKVASYNSEDLILTFTLASETGYSTPSISGITMGGVALTESSGDFKTGTNVIVATYSAPTLMINRANVTGNLVITGSSIVSTYTVTISRNDSSYGTVSASSVANVPYGTSIVTSGNTLTVNGSTITATPTEASGYTTVFSGWTIPSGEITGNTTITANFTRTANLVISLDNQLADTTGTISVIPTGSTLPNITVPTKSGCLFGGYYTSQYGAGTKYYNADGTPATTWSGSNNITLYAKWMNHIELTSPTNNVSLSTNNNAKNWSGTLEYCLSTPTNSTTWTTWDGTTTIGGTTRTIYLRGTGNAYLTGSSAFSKYWVIGCASNDVACNGNIMSLLDCTKTPLGASITMSTYAFAYLFNNCDKLVSAPELPATTLAGRCYQNMFQNCTSLTTAPALPATTLAQCCYYGMFYDCSSLVNAPVLPATTLASQCYSNMFTGCSSLVDAPTLPATTLADYCYYAMFFDCTSLVNATALPATTLANYCYNVMFGSCTNLENIPALPATTLASNCYNSMFDGCIKIKLSTTQTGAYQNAYRVPYSGTGTDASGALTNMFSNTWGIFAGTPSINTTYYTINNILLPSGEIFAMDRQFYFSSLNGFSLTANSGKTWDGTIEYSTDALSWTTWDGTSISSSSSAPYTLYLRGTGNTVITGNNSSYYWVLTGSNISCNGNIENLLDYSAVALGNHPTMANYAFAYLFYNCTSLTAAPTLPATTLQSYCYYSMFYGCTNLTTAPALPATTLANSCYYYMFYNCSSLTTAPALPAATLASSCYSNMFYGCTSLVNAPALPATTLANYCYSSMFEGCTSLITAPSLPATTLATYCYSNMFRNCSSLITVPALPATILADYCYQYMFSGCTSLITAPALPATTLATYCYSSMFSNCTGLITAPALPATTLADYCYQSMFYGCSSLTTAPTILPATDLTGANYCYQRMFSGCTKLITAPALPATTLAGNCYQYMFSSCNNLITIPALPATTLASSCYYQMFSSCSKIKLSTTQTGEYQNAYRVPYSGTGTDATSALNNMFSSTGGTLTGTPTINTTYYTSNDVILPSGEVEVGNCIHFSSSNEFCLKANTKGWNGTLEYRTTDTWATWDGSAIVANSIYLRGTGNNKIGGNSNSYRWTLLGSNISCNGNIENLLDYSTVALGDHPTMANYAFAYLFYNCANLVSAPALPATTLANYCYQNMFQNCTSLVSAPALPATTLAERCYYYMFYGCSSLTTAPVLPATTLATYCYYYMFNGCSSLTTAPALPATTLATYCYNGMFYGCTSLTTAPALPATTLANYCYVGMFWDCKSLVNAPALPATTLADSCYYRMFQNCTSLTTAPALPATTLANYCYNYMFQYCTNLEVIPSLAHVTTWATNCCQNMFSSCSKVKVSDSNTGAYTTPLLTTGGTTSYFSDMFISTGGTFKGTPAASTTYYTSNEVIYPPKAITFHYYSYSERPFSSYRWSDEGSDSSGDIIDGVTYYVKEGDYHLYKTAACDVYLMYAIISGKSVDWITLYDGTNNSIGGDSGHKDGTSYSFIPHEDSIDWYSLGLTDIYVSAFDN